MSIDGNPRLIFRGQVFEVAVDGWDRDDAVNRARLMFGTDLQFRWGKVIHESEDPEGWPSRWMIQLVEEA